VRRAQNIVPDFLVLAGRGGLNFVMHGMRVLEFEMSVVGVLVPLTVLELPESAAPLQS
jgi:hypothetical protein